MKVKCGPRPLVYPIPITLVGAMIESRPNFTTIGDCGLMGIEPPLVCVSTHADHLITRGILENSAFSINFPHTKMLAKTDYCGMVSGRDIDKSALFNVFYGESGKVPMITECPVSLECVVIQVMAVKKRRVFIGEVVQCHVDPEYILTNDGAKGLVDMKSLDPIIYALDNRYYRIGEVIGEGYKEGLKIK